MASMRIPGRVAWVTIAHPSQRAAAINTWAAANSVLLKARS